MTNRKIEALQEAAAQKAKESAERVDKAIARIIKDGGIISFKSIAQAANVSTAYLYKQETFRNRIETLRDQQKQRPKSKQPPLSSDNSKLVIISTLREENKRLKAEIDSLRRINESLTGKLYQVQGISELVERLKIENEEMKLQLNQFLHPVQQTTTLPVDHPKVISLEKSKAGRSSISEQVKQQLKSLDIPLNSTLTKTIKSVSEAIVFDAIAVLKGILADGDVDKPGSWLKTAIEQGWKPNGKIHVKSELEVFNKWYPKAKQKKIIQASQITENGILIYTGNGEWIAFSEMLIQYPLETL